MNYILFKRCLKNKEIFYNILTSVLPYYKNLAKTNLIIIPTKDLKVAEGVIFGKKISLIQFIIQEKQNKKYLQNILEKELLNNNKVINYTTQIDQIIQIIFDFTNEYPILIHKQTYQDENFILPKNFYKQININMSLLKQNHENHKEINDLFSLDDYDQILENIQKDLSS